MFWWFKGKWDCNEKCDQLHSLVKSPKQKYNKIVKIVDKCIVILRGNPGEEIECDEY